MPPFMSSSKVIRRLFLNGDRWIKCSSKDNGRLGNYAQIRCLCSIVDVIEGFSSANRSIAAVRKDIYTSFGIISDGVMQRRGFLGCGDGEESSVLSKKYDEKRVIGYSQEQLFAVVAAVDLYEDFLPWCQRSSVIRRHSDGSFDAELEIGFKLLVESYVSRVELNKPNYIKTSVSESSLFDHLINIWEFNPGPVAGSCNLHFFVDFKFQSPFYGQMANMFFKEVVSRLVGSFNDRCRLVYGPGVPLLENTYEQRA